MEYVYNCYDHRKMSDRCSKIEKPSNNIYDFETLEECKAKCFTDKELNMIKLLKSYNNPKSLVDMVQPQVSNIIDQIKEIPLLSHFSEHLNRKPYHPNMLRRLYSLLSSTKMENKNYFLIDIIEKNNSIHGNMIRFNYDHEKFDSQFNNGDYIKTFIDEIKLLKDKNMNCLVKEIGILKPDSGHACVMVCKFIKNILNVFVYDPTYSKENETLDQLEKFVTGVAKKLEDTQVKFVNLSRIYGLQNFEIMPIETNLYKKITADILMSIDEFKDIIQDFIKNRKTTVQDLFNEEIDTLIINKLKDKVKNTYFSDLPEDHNDIFVNIFNKFLEKYYEQQKQLFLKTIDFSIFAIDTNSVNFNIDKATHDIFTKLKIFLQEIDSISNEVYSKFNIDYYYFYCYLWCNYTVILILINPTLDPYDIIKYSFYQTDNIQEMNKIFEEYKLNNFENQIKDDIIKIKLGDFFIENKLNEKIQKLKENKSIIINRLSNIALIKHQKILYIKITNLLLLNAKYNLMKNRDIFEQYYDLHRSIFENSFIDREKLLSYDDIDFWKNSLTNNLNFKTPFSSETTDDIIKSVSKGETYNNLIHYILYEDKDIAKIMKKDGGYYQKYLKYKAKYLKIKN